MCRLIRFFYLLIPIHVFRDFLIQKHFDGCSVCQKEWVTDQGVHSLSSKPGWVEQEYSLWFRIQERIDAGEFTGARSIRRKTRFLIPRWQWALAGSVLLILIGLYFVLYRIGFHEPSEQDVSLALKNPQVHIIRAEIHGKKATPFIYHTQENLFIWFDETSEEED
jgi:hypothetical protein